MRKTVLGILLVAAVVSTAQDSPLVAAAKKSNRKAPKSKVITNDTLARSGGRVSIASGDAKPLPNVPTTATSAPAAAPADKSPKLTKAQQEKDPIAGYQTTVRNIDPQSTIRTSTPQTSTTARAPQAAPASMPTPTATNIAPSSSARNVEPQVVQPAKPQ